MDRELVDNKLEPLRRCVRRAEAKCPEQVEALAGDYDAQDILAPNLTRAVGFRNVAIHNDRAIDWAIVHTICREHLGDFRAFARAVDDRLG
jgi:hypothetical protein